MAFCKCAMKRLRRGGTGFLRLQRLMPCFVAMTDTFILRTRTEAGCYHGHDTAAGDNDVYIT